MKMFPIISTFVRGTLLTVLMSALLSFSSAFGDDGNPGTLTDIHNALLQAVGHDSDTPPTLADQTELVNKALKMADQLPPVYHGKLAKAKRLMVAALNELGNGDSANKAKEDIYDADREIKDIMESSD